MKNIPIEFDEPSKTIRFLDTLEIILRQAGLSPSHGGFEKDGTFHYSYTGKLEGAKQKSADFQCKLVLDDNLESPTIQIGSTNEITDPVCLTRMEEVRVEPLQTSGERGFSIKY